MIRIHVLDESTANQIAAGEVVERPFSVVKELVENALDAGAERIVVEVESGGRDLIRVTDNGSGMSPEDAKLALQRHATSKIRSAEDLLAVNTLGFRGEAIPSMASVSRFELVTREADSLAGYRLYVEGGSIVEEGECGCSVGTRVTVRDLFFNTPARLKYLKTNATEMGQIGDMLSRLALSNPQVAVRFHSGKTQVFATPGTGRVLDAATAVLGRAVVKELIEAEYQGDAARVWGYVGRPAAARAGRNHQYFFVNGRSVRTTPVRYALEEAYRHLLPKGRYPVCILFIEVEPQEVDVNVHPAKAEVRFQRDREVRAAVYRAARQALGAHLLIPGTTISPDGEVTVPDRAGEKAAVKVSRADLTGNGASGGASGWVPPGAGRVGQGGGRAQPPPWVPAEESPEIGQVLFRLNHAQTMDSTAETGQVYQEAPLPASEADLIQQLRPLGQVHQSYIVCDGPEGLYVIDQHAAHERIFFERLMTSMEEAEAPVQPLLFPITLDLTPPQMALWQEHAVLFRESGFEAEPFGGNTLLIKGVPASLGDAHVARLVSDFLDRLQEERVEPGSPVTQKRQQVTASMAACKAAIKARDWLQPEDIQALLRDLSRCESPVTCPHGRPTVICIGIPELEKRFKR